MIKIQIGEAYESITWYCDPVIKNLSENKKEFVYRATCGFTDLFELKVAKTSEEGLALQERLENDPESMARVLTALALRRMNARELDDYLKARDEVVIEVGKKEKQHEIRTALGIR